MFIVNNNLSKVVNRIINLSNIQKDVYYDSRIVLPWHFDMSVFYCNWVKLCNRWTSILFIVFSGPMSLWIRLPQRTLRQRYAYRVLSSELKTNNIF